MKKVFISYSHKDEEWKKMFRPHLDMLEKAERLIVWDDSKIDGGEKWYPEIEQALDDAAVAVCLISANYLASDFITDEEIPHLLAKREREGTLLLPILIHHCLWEKVKWLEGIQMLPRNGMSIAEDFKGIEHVAFTEVARCISAYLDGKYKAPEARVPTWASLPDIYIDIERLPKTGEEVFGRAKELAILDEAWKSPDISIISFVAWGGVGKSALVNKWVHHMSNDNYRGARRVYAWSFYSQGTGQRITSADTFIDHALRWFGDSNMADSARSPWDKGNRLAELIQQHRTLLILDGLEPLQSNFKHDKGAVKDPALSVLLVELAKENSGLCVITSRERLTGIPKESMYQKNLQQISPEAGRALLRIGGVQGTDSELEQATRDFGNHALAVNLLTAYLQDTADRHIKNAVGIPGLDIPEEDDKHPRRVMQALADRLGPSPELNVLHMIGLFDRPASAKEINWLRTWELVPNLTDKIRWLDDKDWNRVLSNLRRLRLIAPESRYNLGGLDAHPHVREHFAQHLKENKEESWKQGHSGLFEFLKNLAPLKPKTIEKMTPLCFAVAHACHAERYKDALKIYRSRIKRGGKNFHVDTLGAMSAELALLANFYILPWTGPVALRGADLSFVLSITGLRLRGAGLLKEAENNMKTGLSLHIKQRNWKDAANTARHLSNLYLITGRLDSAEEIGTDSIKYIRRTNSTFKRMAALSALAHAYHQIGHFQAAVETFKEAEQAQKEWQTKRPCLYGLQGYRYCDLLLDQGHHRAVAEHTSKTLDWCKKPDFFKTGVAMTHISWGRAASMKGSVDEAQKNFDLGVNILREAGQIDKLPLGLLARAGWYRARREFLLAHRDLDEAFNITRQCGMRLFECDCYLEYARTYVAESHIQQAHELYEEGAKQIEEMGYHRRDPEVLLIKAGLEIIEGDKKAAKKTLKKAKDRIDEMSYHRLDIEVERLKNRL